MSASSSKTSRSKTPTNNTLSRFDRGPDDLLRHFASSTSSLTISPEFLFLVLLELLVLYLTDSDPVKSRLLFQLEVAFLQTSGILSKSDTLPLLSIRESPHFQKYVRVLRDSIERALQVVQQPPSVSGSQSIATILEKEYAKMILTTPLPSNITIDIPQPDLQLRVPIPFSMNGNVTTNDFENVVVFRYIQDFYELDKLGKGAFGSVFRASNHLDNRMYAIKKIVFNENTDRTRREAQRALREVRVLASLSHPNIVQYHCAWLELVPVEMRRYQSKSSQVKSRSLAQVKPDDSLDDLIQFEAQSSSHAVNPKGTKDETRPKSSTTSTSPDDDDGDDESEVSAMGTNGEVCNLQNHHQCHSDGDHLSLSSKITLHHSTSCHESESKEKVTRKALMPVSFRNAQLQLRTASSSSSKGPYVTSKIVLFIQMQLCDTTLHEWLRHRDQAIVEELSETSCQLNESGQKECWNIFKQLLTAIEYLHSQSFVHRDIKPRNIFLSYDSKDPSSVHVKLGDFGLATLLDVESTPNSPTQIVNSESSGVGTALYAAPEQLNSRRCLATAKCDSYSLGIVLFELFNIFSTEMERYSCLSDLRVNTKIDQYFAELYPFEANLIEQLVSVDRERRPDVDQILAMCTAQINQRIKKQQHGSKQKMIEQLKETLRDRDRRIRELELELDRRK